MTEIHNPKLSLLVDKPIQSTFTRRESIPVPADWITYFTGEQVTDTQHQRTDTFIGRCPFCRGTNMIRPGLPPGPHKTHVNRCSVSQLSGKSGTGKSGKMSWSWWNPKRKSGLCSFPLTYENGAVIPMLDFNTFRDFTHYDFKVKELLALAYELLNIPESIR